MISETLSLLLLLIIGITCFFLNYVLVTIVVSVVTYSRKEEEEEVYVYATRARGVKRNCGHLGDEKCNKKAKIYGFHFFNDPTSRMKPRKRKADDMEYHVIAKRQRTSGGGENDNALDLLLTMFKAMNLGASEVSYAPNSKYSNVAGGQNDDDLDLLLTMFKAMSLGAAEEAYAPNSKYSDVATTSGRDAFDLLLTMFKAMNLGSSEVAYERGFTADTKVKIYGGGLYRLYGGSVY